MELYYHHRFRKQLGKLSPKLQRKVRLTLDIFEGNPRDSRLRNHALSGRFGGQRSISVTGDVRIIFEKEDDYEKVILLQVGTHSEIYR